MIPLTSHTSIPHAVGNKARLLAYAASNRLPVPSGVVLLDQQELSSLNERLSTMAGPFAVRSAFSAEDRAGESLAGFFDSKLWVPKDRLEEAVADVRASADRLHAESIRRDVLIMEMVDPALAGVAFLQTDFIDDLINYAEGTADKLVSGEVEGTSTLLPRRVMGPVDLANLSPLEGGTLTRLQTLLSNVRRLFGDKDWDIEWADDGTTCWLVQIRPITRPPRRNEAFTYANIREIMPDPPSTLMAEIVAQSSADLFAYYRSFDQTLPANRPMIEMFAGRPLFNISLLVDMMRWWGLPSSLVTNSIGGQSDRESAFNLRRFMLRAPVLLRQGWSQLNAVRSSKKATTKILALANSTGPGLGENGIALRKLFVALVSEMFNLTAALSGPLLILRLTNTLNAHNRRNRTISTEMYTDLAPLRDLGQQDESIRTALIDGQLPDQPEFQSLWSAWINKHGRRGVYESDIARPRYHEAPEGILQSLARPVPTTSKKVNRSLLEWLTLPVWWQCQRVLSAREWWRYYSMDAYDILRQNILSEAERYAASGQLPSVERIWDLTPEEWGDLEAGETFDAAFWEMRDEEIEDVANYDFPDLMHRFDDLDQYRPGASLDQSERASRLSGVSLTDGTVSGQAWVLTQPETTLPDHLDPENTILVARSVDAGWIPTFSLVSGVAVEIGGDLSHGSIILREIGLPAVTNIKHLTRHIETGDQITLKAGSGIIQINNDNKQVAL